MKTYTKKDISAMTAKKSNVKLKVSEKVTNELFKVLRNTLMSASPEIRIEIRNLGVFEVHQTNPKPNARNPKTGEKIYIPAKRKVHFKPGKYIKSKLKKSLKE